MTTIKLTKMQGCGNDFVIIDYAEYEKTNMPMDELAKKVCDRNFGVGADGMIIPKLNPSPQPSPHRGEGELCADIAWYFYNSDGSTAQMCGNGIRCFAKYVYDKKILNKKTFSVLTGAGIIRPELLDDGNVRVNMGMPILEYEKIPFRYPIDNSPHPTTPGRKQADTNLSTFQPFNLSTNKGERTVKVLDKEFSITPVSMGNPHCVIFTDNEPIEDAKKYGPYIEKHEYFPEKTNTEFVRVKSRNEIDLCVYERGCGITLACGTGACASVVAGVLNNLTENKVKVNLPGGAVFIDWQGSKEDREKNIFMTGPANYSFVADYML